MVELLNLFGVFFKIGLFTFGGGYAMLPLLQDEIVKKRNWASDEEMMDYYSIGQCTPGIISINVSTFIGYKRRGVVGALVATMGMIIPSLMIIMLAASFLKQYMDNNYLSEAFAGIRIAVTALIADILWNLFPKSVKNRSALIIFGCSLLLLFLFHLSAAMLVIIAACFGFFAGVYARRKRK